MENRQSPKVFGHRGEFSKHRVVETEHGVEHHGGQNSVEAGKSAFQYCGGAEVDLTFTKDGVGVISHDDVSGMDYDEFKKKYPTHATCESWMDWLNQPGMEQKIIYLDLKGGEQDPGALIKMVHEKGLGSRVSIGTKNPEIARQLLEARQELGAGAKIYLQIPEPSAAWYWKNTDNFKLNEKLAGQKPDGVHFFWPENVIKNIVAEKVGENRFVPFTDRSVFLPRFPNIPFFHNLQRRRLRRFAEAAKKAGMEVVAGSASSAVMMETMVKDWGVDAIMPNIAGHMPEGTGKPSPQGVEVPPPESLDARSTEIFGEREIKLSFKEQLLSKVRKMFSRKK